MRPEDVVQPGTADDCRHVPGAPRMWDTVNAIEPPAREFWDATTFMPSESRERQQMDDFLAEVPNFGKGGLSGFGAGSGAEEAPLDVTWLGSLRSGVGLEAAAPKASARGGGAELSSAVAAWAGKALDIPPFWRTKPEEELEQVFYETRSDLWQRMRRLAKDAKRRDAKRGLVRTRHHF
mmetsp:Transcript_5716/g.16597  ORF Transcript_5716/g.16597 Transcript_5716/m.16597 type:complete len:179 (+) Transcript_5716:4795-5331(+)